ncbi:MAG: hypothetical protein P8X65_12525 [Syntrophobacterales bacterium]|jgi:hypothetical protein
MARTMSVKEVSLTFAAGVLGGLANSLAIWLFGVVGLNQLLGVALAPELTPAWLYPRLVWGGLWAWLFLLPRPKLTYTSRGIIFSLGPSLVQMFVVFPLKAHKGVGGIELGALTPLLVLFYNAIWGLVTAVWLKWSRSR